MANVRFDLLLAVYTLESSDDEDAFLIAIRCIVHISGRSAVALACSERSVAVGDTYSLVQMKGGGHFEISWDKAE